MKLSSDVSSDVGGYGGENSVTDTREEMTKLSMKNKDCLVERSVMSSRLSEQEVVKKVTKVDTALPQSSCDDLCQLMNGINIKREPVELSDSEDNVDICLNSANNTNSKMADGNILLTAEVKSDLKDKVDVVVDKISNLNLSVKKEKGVAAGGVVAGGVVAGGVVAGGVVAGGVVAGGVGDVVGDVVANEDKKNDESSYVHIYPEEIKVDAGVVGNVGAAVADADKQKDASSYVHIYPEEIKDEEKEKPDDCDIQNLEERGPTHGRASNYLPSEQSHNALGTKIPNYSNTAPVGYAFQQCVPTQMNFSNYDRMETRPGKRRPDDETTLPWKFNRPPDDLNNLDNPNTGHNLMIMRTPEVNRKTFTGGQVMVKSPEIKQTNDPIFSEGDLTDILQMLDDTQTEINGQINYIPENQYGGNISTGYQPQNTLTSTNQIEGTFTSTNLTPGIFTSTNQIPCTFTSTNHIPTTFTSTNQIPCTTNLTPSNLTTLPSKYDVNDCGIDSGVDSPSDGYTNDSILSPPPSNMSTDSGVSAGSAPSPKGSIMDVASPQSCYNGIASPQSQHSSYNGNASPQSQHSGYNGIASPQSQHSSYNGIASPQSQHSGYGIASPQSQHSSYNGIASPQSQHSGYNGIASPQSQHSSYNGIASPQSQHSGYNGIASPQSQHSGYNGIASPQSQHSGYNGIASPRSQYNGYEGSHDMLQSVGSPISQNGSYNGIPDIPQMNANMGSHANQYTGYNGMTTTMQSNVAMASPQSQHGGYNAMSKMTGTNVTMASPRGQYGGYDAMSEMTGTNVCMTPRTQHNGYDGLPVLSSSPNSRVSDYVNVSSSNDHGTEFDIRHSEKENFIDDHIEDFKAVMEIVCNELLEEKLPLQFNQKTSKPAIVNTNWNANVNSNSNISINSNASNINSNASNINSNASNIISNASNINGNASSNSNANFNNNIINHVGIGNPMSVPTQINNTPISAITPVSMPTNQPTAQPAPTSTPVMLFPQTSTMSTMIPITIAQPLNGSNSTNISKTMTRQIVLIPGNRQPQTIVVVNQHPPPRKPTQFVPIKPKLTSQVPASSVAGIGNSSSSNISSHKMTKGGNSPKNQKNAGMMNIPAAALSAKQATNTPKKNCGKNLLNIARRLVATMSRDQIKYQDKDGDTYLHVAVCKADKYMVQALLERQVREELHNMVDIQNNLRQTPLYLAVSVKQPEMVAMFIEYKADVNILAECMLDNGTREVKAAIHCAAAQGQEYLPTLQTLFKHPELNLNLANSDGQTALHCAIRNHSKPKKEGFGLINSIPVIEFLIRSGADPNSQDKKSGKTPLMYAMESKNIDLIVSTVKAIEKNDPIRFRSYLKAQSFDGKSCLKIFESMKPEFDHNSLERLSILFACNGRGAFSLGH